MSRREPFIGNPQVAEIMRGRPKHEMLMVALMERAFGAELVNDAVQSLTGSATNISATIPEAGGKPVSHFIGKDRKQLMREFGDDEEKVDAICVRMEENGFTIPDNHADPASDEEVSLGAERARNASLAALESSKTGGGVKPVTPGNPAKSFGEDQFPASELWHMSDEELRRVDGISDADVAEIRRLQSEAAEDNASGGNPPPPQSNPETSPTGDAPTNAPPAGGTGDAGTDSGDSTTATQADEAKSATAPKGGRGKKGTS